MRVINFSELSQAQEDAYNHTQQMAYPDMLLNSKAVKVFWPQLEEIFPEYQLFVIDDAEQLVGFINTIPFFYDQSVAELPAEGWDWLLKKGIDDHQKDIAPNHLGGLQIGICADYRGQGWSKFFIDQGKSIKAKLGLEKMIIPIRPAFKSKYPKMKMEDYIALKTGDKIFDPWIRTHVSQGAEIIKVCNRSMIVNQPLDFWRPFFTDGISASGKYFIEGGLNEVEINLEENKGTYHEDNIWICYQ